MMKERKNEKDLILSDAAVCHVLKRESDALGVSLEEYVERFLMAFYEEPQRFYSILESPCDSSACCEGKEYYI